MDPINLASGDNIDAVARSSRYIDKDDGASQASEDKVPSKDFDEMTPQTIEDNEIMLKERIAQCRDIIETLKFELNEEKSKLEREKKMADHELNAVEKFPMTRRTGVVSDLHYDTSMYSACVESRLSCDENLIEYEKQLQKYENTLNMAQTEKKHAIRRKMLAKAFKLKLMEVENQCNIELLRVKQSLQCLEPLKIIASKWNTNTGNLPEDYDYSSFELMLPPYTDSGNNSCNDASSTLKQFDTLQPQENTDCGDMNESVISEC